jgi:hypothetical protein
MSDATIVAVIGLFGTGTAATIAAYAGTRHRIRAELEGEYDSDLRKSRLGVYPSLWSALEPLAKYARDPPGYPDREEIGELSVALRTWYFETGGLFLSAESRQAYFDLQDALTVVVTSERWTASDLAEELDEDMFEALRQLGSWLRTTLTYGHAAPILARAGVAGAGRQGERESTREGHEGEAGVGAGQGAAARGLEQERGEHLGLQR